jgi:AraC-like DNA-binding protein/mannose-6-phosphate isomerase-like protein (cupin superfamily)
VGSLLKYLSHNISITTKTIELVRGFERRLSTQKSAEFAHDRHQLLVVAEGAVSVHNNFGIWSVPAGCAGWIPAGARHALAGHGAARARTLYIWRPPRAFAGPDCRALGVTPLLRAITDHFCRLESVRSDGASSKRIAAVLLDVIAGQQQLPLCVPVLRSPLAQRVAAALQSDPADTPRIRDLAAAIGVSGRTIERAFMADVSMTIGDYRHRARIAHAIVLLAGGASVKDVALEVGYETASALVTAFRKSVGATPGKTRRTRRTRRLFRDLA